MASDTNELEKPTTNSAGQNAGSATPSDRSILHEKEQFDGQYDKVDVDGYDGEQDDGGGELERVESSLYPSTWKLVTILIAVSLAVFLVALDMTIVSTAIPRITDQFHSLDQVGWYGSAFFLTVAAFQATWGKAYKYFPLKTSFLVAISIFELGSLICAVANDSTALIVGRAIAGAGGAGIGSGCYTIIAFSAPPKQTAAYTGILGAVYAVASVVGPLLGGVFTDDLSWRWCFYVNLPIGGLSAALIFLRFQTPKQAKPQQATWREKFLQMDFPGTFILMAAIVCLILALQWGGVSKSWGSADVIGVLVGFGLIVLVFIIVEIWQDDYALLVPRLIKTKTIAFLSGFQIFNFGVFMVLLYYLPIYFQSVLNVSAASSGIHNLPFILAVALCTVVSGVGITLTGQYLPWMVMGSAFGTIGAGLLYTLDIGTSPSKWIGYQALAGIGMGFGIQIPVIVAQAVVEPSDISPITAIMIFVQTLSGAIFVSTGQSLFANELLKTVPKLVPGLNSHLVVATGATEIRNTFAPNQVPGIVLSYMTGLKDAYTLGIASAGTAMVVAVLAVIFDRRRINHPGGAAGAA